MRVQSPIGNLSFHVVDADTPFLLSLHDLDKLNVYYNNLSNMLIGKNTTWPVIRKFGHPFLIWGESLSNYCTTMVDHGDDTVIECQLTETELRQLHRRFGHPSTYRMMKLLSRSKHSFDQAILKQIRRLCEHCQKHGRSPGRFRFTLKDDHDFNYAIIVDIMYIGEPARPVLHAVDEATRFQAAQFLKDVSTTQV